MSLQTYGLIGYPVGHSLSPLMHNAAFRALGIAAEYKLFPLKEEELEGFLRSAAGNNICGLNVTVPYKEKVVVFLDHVSAEAGQIGSVNTIKITQGRLEGFNTDASGFIRHLSEDLKFKALGKNVALIGAGGAARAIAVYLSKEQASSIAIYDIDRNKAQKLIDNLKANFSAVEFRLAGTIAGLDIKNCSLLINATPVGMKESGACLVDEKFIHKDLLVYDLIYNPKETKLLKTAKKKGASVANGLGMLLYQGAGSFTIWTGLDAPVEVMRKALNEGAKNI